MTTPCASRIERRPGAGKGLVFWYQAVRLARASAACRYRMGHFAELLGGATTFVDRRPDALGAPRVLVVVRPFVDAAAERVLAAARRAGARLVADFDDLIFAGDPHDYPLVLNGSLDARTHARRTARHRAGLAFFDAFTAATEPLSAELRAILPEAPIACVPNGLSASWVRQGRALARPWQPGDPRVIRFLSGSPSHDADFATIAPVLGELCRAHPEVSLEVVGPVAVNGLEGCRRLPRVPYVDLPRLIASSWVTLAPLRTSRFNGCKSAIKFLESAAFGAPCIASPIADMQRHEQGGVILARDGRDWYRELSRLFDDDHRMAVARQSRRYVDRHGYADRGAEVLSAFIESWPKIS